MQIFFFFKSIQFIQAVEVSPALITINAPFFFSPQSTAEYSLSRKKKMVFKQQILHYSRNKFKHIFGPSTKHFTIAHL